MGGSPGGGISQASCGDFGEDMADTTGTGIPPIAEASDHPDVAVLLKAATALWEDKDIDGALRWYARAAEAAGDVGDDRRALALARAVADLKDTLAPREHSTAPETRPPASKTPTPSASKMPPPPSARKASLAPKPSSTPKPPLKNRSIPPTLPETPAAASASPTLPPPPVTASAPPAAPQTPAPASVRPKAPKAIDAAGSNGASPHNGEADANSVRVSIKTSVRDPDLLIVRVLKKGQSAPSGWGEGTLAPTGRGFDLANLRG